MKKLTKEQALELLSVVMPGAELAGDNEPGDPITQDEFLQLIDAAREPVISQKVLAAKNDELHKDITKKVNYSMRKALADATGVPVSEIDGKDVAEALKIGLDKYGKTLGTDKEAFTQQLNEVLESHKLEKASILKAESEKYNALESKYTRKATLDSLLAEYDKAKGIKPTANKKILAEDFLSALEREAIVKVSEKGEIELYDRNKPEIRLLNSSNNGFQNVADRIKEYHSLRDQWHEDTRQENLHEHMKHRGPDVKTDPILQDGKVVSPLEQQLASISSYVNTPAAA